jgi:hypothetical protein
MSLKNRTICSGIRLLFVAGASSLLLQTANATLLFSDGFNYTAGTTLKGNDGWTLGSVPLSITNANLTYPNLVDLGGNALSVTQGVASSTVANFSGSAVTAGTVYFSFVLAPTVLPTANTEVAALLSSGSSGPSGSADPLGLYVGLQSAGQYKIGVRHGGSGATYATNTGMILGSTNFFVIAYTFNPSTTDDSVSLWVNPTPGGSLPAADVTVIANSGTVDAANLQVVGFKANSGTGAGNWVYDTLRIGDTWADVTPALVPEPSTVLLVGAGLGLMLGLVRRRRS